MNIPTTATSSLQLRPTARPERRAVNGTATVARRVTYDDLGRTVSVVRGGKAGAIGYTYNVRGLLTSIVSPGLEMRLHYNDGPGTARWDGMISAMTWKCPDRERRRGYLFTYNSRGWLTDAVYGENDAVTTNPNRYSERVTSYTLNGAIRRLQRHGLKDNGVYGKIDNLNITLEGNRVVAVTDDAAPLLRAGSTDFADGSDTTAEYTYNGVGALTSDANRGITLIEYDNLNHPRRVSFRDGHTVEWVYAPDGTRLRAIHTTAVEGVSVAPGMRSEPDAAHIVRRDTTDYSAGVTWGPGNRLERVEIPGGYATIGAGGVPRYHYYTADHVGNNRVVVSEDGVIEQVVHYYPFGGQYADAGLNLSAQQYKHGGKELDPAYGLDWHDFGARPYYAPLAAWLHPDALAGDYTWLSPYCYCANNPVNASDPTGNALVFNGLSSADSDSIMSMISNASSGYIKLHVEDKKEAWLEYDKSIPDEALTKEQKAIRYFLSLVIEDKETTTIKVHHGTSVLVGDRKSGTIDINDIMNFQVDNYKTPAGALIHEIWEQYKIQVKNAEPMSAHTNALNVEGMCCGFRPDTSDSNERLNFKEDGSNVIIMRYIPNDEPNVTIRSAIYFDRRYNIIKP